jgi:hypothetical protein
MSFVFSGCSKRMYICKLVVILSILSIVYFIYGILVESHVSRHVNLMKWCMIEWMLLWRSRPCRAKKEILRHQVGESCYLWSILSIVYSSILSMVSWSNHMLVVFSIVDLMKWCMIEWMLLWRSRPCRAKKEAYATRLGSHTIYGLFYLSSILSMVSKHVVILVYEIR